MSESGDILQYYFEDFESYMAAHDKNGPIPAGIGPIALFNVQDRSNYFVRVVLTVFVQAVMPLRS